MALPSIGLTAVFLPDAPFHADCLLTRYRQSHEQGHGAANTSIHFSRRLTFVAFTFSVPCPRIL